MTCKTCRWWKTTNVTSCETKEERSCTRYPPVRSGETGYEGCMVGEYPLTPEHLTACGEYVAMTAKDPVYENYPHPNRTTGIR